MYIKDDNFYERKHNYYMKETLKQILREQKEEELQIFLKYDVIEELIDNLINEWISKYQGIRIELLYEHDFGYELLLKYNLLDVNKNYEGFLAYQPLLFYFTFDGYVYDNYEKAFDLFIKAGFDVNSKNDDGETVLLHCMNNSYVSNLLIDNNADVFIFDRKGFSFLDLINERIEKLSNEKLRNIYYQFRLITEYPNELKGLIKLKERVESIVEKTLTSLFLKHTNLFKELIDIIIKFYK
jgi:ankyrin repeat protein